MHMASLCRRSQPPPPSPPPSKKKKKTIRLRVGEVAESEGHHPDLHLVGYNRVTAQLSTHSVHGLTENDFIMAVRAG